MELINTIRDMKAWSRKAHSENLKIGFVPTMGYLHEGHLSLVSHARKHCDRLVVSIFVNPMQFGPTEDLDVYPRDLDRDLDLLRPLDVDCVFIPDGGEIYPDGYQTNVKVADVTSGLCGAFRPAFFGGVATVVLKLFNIITPDVAVFGEKDYQQLITVRRMVRDLHLDVDVIGRPTVREADGLAMSSRNVYLSEEERKSAKSLSEALTIAKELALEGTVAAGEILEAVRTHIESYPGTQIQYASLVDPEKLTDVDRVEPRAVLALAVIIGKTRLIDNAMIHAG